MTKKDLNNENMPKTSFFSRLNAWDYLYFAISLLVMTTGLAIFGFGEIYHNTLVRELGAVLVAVGVVTTFVERVFHRQLENVYKKQLEEMISLIDLKLGSYGQNIALIDRLNISGITNIVPSREFYDRDISAYISKAKNSLIMTSITLESGIQNEKIQKTILKLVKQGVKIQISLVNPQNDIAIASLSRALNITHKRLSEEIRGNIRILWDERNTLDDLMKKNFKIKIHDCIPFASAILIDVLEPNDEGIIQIETKSYKAGWGKSFAIEVKGRNNYTDGKVLYKTLRDSWLELINDAIDYNLNNSNSI